MIGIIITAVGITLSISLLLAIQRIATALEKIAEHRPQEMRHEVTMKNLGAFEDAICRYQTKEAILDFIRKRRKAMESECGTVL